MLYSLISRLLLPAAWWGRLRVVGLDAVSRAGPTVVVANHDSQWDPVILGVALRKRRKLRFLARANLWKIPGLGPVLNAMRQIPVERGAGDRRALAEAVDSLRAGDAICIFPEGKLSLGERLPARSGVGWLLKDCADAQVVLCGIEGTTDYVRFPKRPRVRVTVFAPPGGGPGRDAEPREIAEGLLAPLRERVPPVPAGRRARPA